MPFWNAVGDWLLVGLHSLWGLFLDWLKIFISPAKNLDVLWIIVPVWLAWFFAEFFQEKKETSFGNAISNGIIPLWVAIDWTRLLVNQLINGKLGFSWHLVVKFVVCGAVLMYGIMIVVSGIKRKEFIRLAGRIRVVTYILLMFTPLIYDLVELSWKYILLILLFFPLFYYVIELIDHLTPNPQSLEMDQSNKGDFGSELGEYGSQSIGGYDQTIGKGGLGGFKF